MSRPIQTNVSWKRYNFPMFLRSFAVAAVLTLAAIPGAAQTFTKDVALQCPFGLSNPFQSTLAPLQFRRELIATSSTSRRWIFRDEKTPMQ